MAFGASSRGIQISGYHRPRKANELFFDMRGPDAAVFFGCMGGGLPTFDNLVNGALPYTNQLVTTASATQDFKFFIDICFGPPWAGQGREKLRQQMPWILDAPNYNRPKLSIQWADAQACFGAGTMPTLSAYGSPAGSPVCHVVGIYALAGKNDLFTGFVPGRIWRYTQENTTGDILAAVNHSRQYQLPVGHRISRVMIKSGLKSTVNTGGNGSYASLSDDIFSNLEVDFGTNKIIKSFFDYYDLKESTAADYGVYPPVGYGFVDWIKHGNLAEALDATNLVAGPTGDVDLTLFADVAGAVNTGAVFMVEELRGKPTFVTS